MSLLSSYSDNQLLELLQQGRQSAFKELYDRYWDKLFVRASLLLNSEHDAEEVVHDIFIQIWNKKDRLRIHHTFNTYIAAMLRYRCFKVIALRRQSTASIDGKLHFDIADNSTVQFIDFESLQENLEKAVSQLPEKCQMVFRLSREQGLTDKQIATHLNLSIHTVRTQIKRALRKLRTSLGNFFLF